MLNWATEYFRENSISSPRLSIEWLLAEVLGIPRLDLYMQYDRPLTRQELNALRPLVKRRVNNEPLQHIVGYTDFYNCRIYVNPDVLIPRPETEQLTELVLQSYNQLDNLRVLDVGTGSGCIAIALKKEQPSWQVEAMDISEIALKTAQKNAELNQTEVTFHQGDYNDPESWKHLSNFNLIISNPPYIPQDEYAHLDTEVKEYEPKVALYSSRPADTIARLLKLCENLLETEGEFFAEINSGQARQVGEVINEQVWQWELLEDYGKSPRFLRAIVRK